MGWSRKHAVYGERYNPEKHRRPVPGSRPDRDAGETSGIADNTRELAFAAVLVLVGIAALYPALHHRVSAESSKNKKNQFILNFHKQRTSEVLSIRSVECVHVEHLIGFI